jgi:N-acetylglutamate synthase-like GNAT family acetyltransferase
MPVLLRGKPGASNLENNAYTNQAFALVSKILWNNRGAFNSYLRSRTRNYLVVNNNGSTVLGFATMAKPKNGRNRLGLIGAKKGYGRVIMKGIYNNAKKRRIPTVNVLNAVNAAQPFYRHMGYAPAPSNSSNGRIFRRAVSSRGPSVHTISSRNVSSVSLKKRARSPRRAGSKSPTSKRRPSPKSPPSSPKSRN